MSNTTPTIASSTFDSSAGGWVDGHLSDTIYSGTNDVVWDSVTQTITTDDPEGGVNNALIAPGALVTGAAVGATLSFQLSDTFNDGVAYSPLSLISTDGTALYANPSVIPSTTSNTLTQYSVLLTASNFYTGDPDDPSGGTTVSAAAFASVVGTLAQIAVDLDWHSGADSVRLDNVILTGPSGSGSVDTIAGAGGSALSLDFGGASLAAFALPLLGGVTQANGLFVTAPGAYAMAAGQSAAVDAAAGAVSITGNGAANESILAGAGPFTFVAGQGGSGSVVAGAGNNFINLAAGGNWLAALGTGADTLVGSFGSVTVNAGGAALYFGGAGSLLFNALGAASTLVGGGAETINAGAANMLVFGGAGAIDFIAGSGASTVVTGAGGATINGGSQGLLYFGTGPTTYNPGTAVDTVLGFTGSLTATGGANGSLIFTGTAGNNVVTSAAGASTIFGFGAGDSLTATGSAANVIAATAASDTINGAGSSGANVFFAFGANDVVLGGSGTTAIQSAIGNHTLVAGSGSTLFEVLASGANRAITIQNFNAAQDFVQLQGYATGSGAAALLTASTSGGNEVLTLTDGTTINFQGVTNLSAGSFV